MNNILELKRLILHDHGQKWARAVNENGEVKYPHQKGELNPETLQQALAGDISIGVMLAQDKTGLTKAGAIDIDIPRDASNMVEGLALARKLQETALKGGLKAYIEYSGNRGYHLWLFVKTAVTYALMQSCLKQIASRAGFEAKEIFPNNYPETKCVKLPGVIHLKSGNRCGFIDDSFDPLNPSPAPDQAGLMGSFIQNDIEAIVQITQVNSAGGDGKGLSDKQSDKYQSVSDKISQHFKDSSHPACINHLLANGVPSDIDYNYGNLTLARYALSKGIADSEAVKLSEKMAEATSDNHPTGKDLAGKVRNFKSAYRSARSKGYRFECSYVLSGLKKDSDGKLLEPVSKRGCSGDHCPLWQGEQSSESSIQKSGGLRALNRVLFTALVNLHSEGKEACKSQILIESENILSTGSFVGEKLTEGESLAEAEVVAYLLREPEAIADYADIFSQGFRAGSSLSIGKYLDYLLTLKLPSQDTIEGQLDLIRNEGVKAVTHIKLTEFNTALKTEDVSGVLCDLLDAGEGLLKHSINSNEIAPMEYHLGDILDNLYNKEHRAIATPSLHLNRLLNGGFQPSRLYVLGAPPANGKSTFCHWVADSIASKGEKYLYVSYEMSREQLLINSLSRIGHINSALIEGKKFLDINYKFHKELDEYLNNAVEVYEESIAPRAVILEADYSHTASKLKAIIKKVQPSLVVIDYLQLMASGDDKLDSSSLEVQRISKIATDLKRLARDTGTAIIAISDINKAGFNDAKKGNDLDMGALRDSFKIAHAADCILLLQSGDIGDKESKLDQLGVLSGKYPDKSLSISEARNKYPLDKVFNDTYSRLSVVKNRGGKLGEPVFRYSRACHTFDAIDLLEIESDQDVI